MVGCTREGPQGADGAHWRELGIWNPAESGLACRVLDTGTEARSRWVPCRPRTKSGQSCLWMSLLPHSLLAYLLKSELLLEV